MKIAIIGAGFTGLSAAYQLIKTGHEVTVFEKDSQPGGLAIGYQEKSWKWTLEKHYHHWFANDKYIIDLAKEINHAVLIPRPKTSVYVDNSIYQLDSPLSVLRFPKLPITDKLRMAAVLGFLKFNPYWQPLEKIHKKLWEKTHIKLFGSPNFIINLILTFQIFHLPGFGLVSKRELHL